MAQDPEIVSRYVEADAAWTRLSSERLLTPPLGDEEREVALEYVVAAHAYVDDLRSNDFVPPAGLDDSIEEVRSLL